ncbi:hypothetical protein MSAN_02438700 [Mycena sanguinolenta]|uniref:Uncharacterized protein n=1 Tax=Mycena sanguinolenta TaxID=230812 RepID=A0A8H6WYU7_9AGAR|nr:hypothetical protein MSAN_02438700 [Mycena sanguinolenta]
MIDRPHWTQPLVVGPGSLGGCAFYYSLSSPTLGDPLDQACPQLTPLDQHGAPSITLLELYEVFAEF